MSSSFVRGDQMVSLVSDKHWIALIYSHSCASGLHVLGPDAHWGPSIPSTNLHRGPALNEPSSSDGGD